MFKPWYWFCSKHKKIWICVQGSWNIYYCTTQPHCTCRCLLSDVITDSVTVIVVIVMVSSNNDKWSVVLPHLLWSTDCQKYWPMTRLFLPQPRGKASWPYVLFSLVKTPSATPYNTDFLQCSSSRLTNVLSRKKYFSKIKYSQYIHQILTIFNYTQYSPFLLIWLNQQLSHIPQWLWHHLVQTRNSLYFFREPKWAIY